MADKERRKRKPLTEEQKQKIREATKRAMQRPDVRAKYEASRKEAAKKMVLTKIKKYGSATAFSRPDVQAKIRQTNLERYGVECCWANKDVQNKIKQTCKERYGVEYGGQLQTRLFDRLGITKDVILEKYMQNNKVYIPKIAEDTGITVSWAFQEIQRICPELPYDWGTDSYKHKTQRQISDFIEQYVPVTRDTRQILSGGRELDVYIPSKHIAIEYDGMLTHSTGYCKIAYCNKLNEQPNEHVNKTNECEAQDIHLFHIFENEWFLKRDIWKSMILNSLGLSNKIYARKCEIKDVANNDAKQFLEQNHLQGYSLCSVRLGLYYNNELVALMTFGKPRFSKKYDYELIRFCCKTNNVVVGGASKLLKHFLKDKHNIKIVSYANRRWSQGALYEKLGFTKVSVSAPNYFYFKDPMTLESRIAYQKHKLKDKLENFDPDKTESQNMYDNGYRKIFDCGNLVYELSV